MSSSYVTFDTLTIGLGDDSGMPESMSLTPPPVLARTPHLQRSRRSTASRSSDLSAGMATFEVMADPVGRRPSPAPRIVPPVKRGVRTETALSRNIVSPTAATELAEENWLVAFLRWQSRGASANKLLLTLLLAAAAGATFVLFRPVAEPAVPVPSEAPAWTAAPLAEAPPFQQEAFSDSELLWESEALASGSPKVAPKPTVAASGPVGVAKRDRVAAAEPAKEDVAASPANPPKTERLATLPAPYPSTGYESPAGVPTIENPNASKPSARLIGILPATPKPSAPHAPSSRHEQNRSGLY